MKRPHVEATMGHLENKTKFKVSDNTTPSVQQKVIGNMNTPSEKNIVNPSNIGL